MYRRMSAIGSNNKHHGRKELKKSKANIEKKMDEEKKEERRIGNESPG